MLLEERDSPGSLSCFSFVLLGASCGFHYPLAGGKGWDPGSYQAQRVKILSLLRATETIPINPVPISATLPGSGAVVKLVA